jgi:carbon starvation protein CstA
MVPISIKAFIASMKDIPILLSFCKGALATSFIFYFVWTFTLSGYNDRGMGVVIVYILFLLVDAALAGVGVICGLAYIVKKTSGRYDDKSHTNTP